MAVTRLYDFLPFIPPHLETDVCVTEDWVTASRFAARFFAERFPVPSLLHAILFPDLMMKAHIAVWIGDEETEAGKQNADRAE